MDKFDMNQRVAIRSVVSFPLYITSAVRGGDTYKVPPLASHWMSMTLEEVQLQVMRGNVMFTGIDGFGKNARLVIEDEKVRAFVFNMPEGEELPKQEVFDLEAAKALFAVSPKDAFLKAFAEKIVTRADKKMAVEYARQLGADNLRKYQVDAIEALGEGKLS